MRIRVGLVQLLEADNLVEPRAITMEVEAHEDGYLARVLQVRSLCNRPSASLNRRGRPTECAWVILRRRCSSRRAVRLHSARLLPWYARMRHRFRRSPPLRWTLMHWITVKEITTHLKLLRVVLVGRSYPAAACCFPCRHRRHTCHCHCRASSSFTKRDPRAKILVASICQG